MRDRSSSITREHPTRACEYFCVVGADPALVRDTESNGFEPASPSSISSAGGAPPPAATFIAEAYPPDALYDVAVVAAPLNKKRRRDLPKPLQEKLSGYSFVKKSVGGGVASLNAGSFLNSPCFLALLRRPLAKRSAAAALGANESFDFVDDIEENDEEADDDEDEVEGEEEEENEANVSMEADGGMEAVAYDDNAAAAAASDAAETGSATGDLPEAVHANGDSPEDAPKRYITSVTIVLEAEIAKAQLLGFEVILKTPDGGDANLNRGGSTPVYLAVRRADIEAPDFFLNAPAPVTDLVVVNRSKDEQAPRGYHLVRRGASCNVGKSFAHEIQLAVRFGRASGVCNVPLKGSTLDRFPAEDNKKMKLPSRELPMFVFPAGLNLKVCSKLDTPLPRSFSFVFTSVKGDLIYVCCLQFYEALDLKADAAAAADSLESELSEEEADSVRARIGKMELGDLRLYAPKVLCVLSLQPLYQSLQRFLRQMYLISLSRTRAPLERYLSTFIQYVPMPMVGGREFCIILDMALLKENEVSLLKPIRLKLPPLSSVPFMDLHFKAPFHCLQLATVLRVFALILLESRILFLSARSQLLLEVVETLRALIFPLQWSSAYIPRLPRSLYALLEAPIGGYIFGIPESSDIYAEDPDFLDYLADQEWLFIVDLDEDDIHVVKHGDVRSMRADPDAAAEVERCVSLLPPGPLDELVATMVGIIRGSSGGGAAKVASAGASGTGMGPRFSIHGDAGGKPNPQRGRAGSAAEQLNRRYASHRKGGRDAHLDTEEFTVHMEARLDAYESAFEFALTPDSASPGVDVPEPEDEERVTLEIREAFLIFMARTLTNFEHYILHPESTVAMEVADVARIGMKPRRTTEIFGPNRRSASKSSLGAEDLADSTRIAPAKKSGWIWGFSSPEKGGGGDDGGEDEVDDGDGARDSHRFGKRDFTLSEHIIGQRFDAGKYLEDADAEHRPLLEKLLETQMFAMMVHQSADHSDVDFQLRFFNRVADAVAATDRKVKEGHWPKSEPTPFRNGLNFLCEPSERKIKNLPGFEVSKIESPGQQARVNNYFNAVMSSSVLAMFKKELAAAGVGDGDPGTPASDRGVGSQYSNARSSQASIPEGEAAADFADAGDDEAESEDNSRWGRASTDAKPVLDINAVDALHDPAFGMISRSHRASVRWRPDKDITHAASEGVKGTLELSNPAATPLLLPGPSRLDGNGPALFGSDGGVWPPTLNPEYLEVPRSEVPPLLLAVSDRCVADLEEQRDRRILTRSKTEVYDRASAAQKSYANAFSAVGTTIVDVYACYFLALPHLVRRSSAPLLDVLYALGLLKRLHRDALLEWLDLPSFRCVLVACGRVGGTFMKCIAGGIFDAMINLGHATNSLLVGLYAQALAEEDEDINLDFEKAVLAHLQPNFSNFETRFAASDWISLAQLGLEWCQEFCTVGAEPYLEEVEAGLARLSRLNVDRRASTGGTPKYSNAKAAEMGPAPAVALGPRRALSRQHSWKVTKSASKPERAGADEDDGHRGTFSLLGRSRSQTPPPPSGLSGSPADSAAKSSEGTNEGGVEEDGSADGGGGGAAAAEGMALDFHVDVVEQGILCFEEAGEFKEEDAAAATAREKKRRSTEGMLGRFLSGVDGKPADASRDDEHNRESMDAVLDKEFKAALLAPLEDAAPGTPEAEARVPCGVVSMWSSRPCDHCGWTPTDEEIQDYWHEQDVRDMGSRAGAGAELLPESEFSCPHCYSSYAPRLGFQLELPGPAPTELPSVSSSRPSSFSNDGEGEAAEGGEAAATAAAAGSADAAALGSLTQYTVRPRVHYSFEYMPPQLLRSELERIVVEVGESALTTTWMLEHARDVYWNMVWYCHRLTVPVPFDMKLDGAAASGAQAVRHEYVMVGWDANVAAHRARIAARLLTPSPARGGRPALRSRECARFFKPWVKLQLGIADIFPELSAQHQKELRQVRKLLLSGQPEVATGAVYILLKMKQDLEGTSPTTGKPRITFENMGLFDRLNIYQLMLVIVGHYSADPGATDGAEGAVPGEPPRRDWPGHLRINSSLGLGPGRPADPSPSRSLSHTSSLPEDVSPRPSPRSAARPEMRGRRAAVIAEPASPASNAGSVQSFSSAATAPDAMCVYGSFDTVLRSFRSSNFDEMAKRSLRGVPEPILEAYGADSRDLIRSIPRRDHIFAFRSALGSLM